MSIAAAHEIDLGTFYTALARRDTIALMNSQATQSKSSKFGEILSWSLRWLLAIPAGLILGFLVMVVVHVALKMNGVHQDEPNGFITPGLSHGNQETLEWGFQAFVAPTALVLGASLCVPAGRKVFSIILGIGTIAIAVWVRSPGLPAYPTILNIVGVLLAIGFIFIEKGQYMPLMKNPFRSEP